jgi:hypothetical protein
MCHSEGVYLRIWWKYHRVIQPDSLKGLNTEKKALLRAENG